MWMGYQSHMGLPEQGNISGLLLPDLQRFAIPLILPALSTELYPSDPLWDGQGCVTPPCCELSFPPGAPWFCKQLPQATTDDIEVRICRDEAVSNEDTPVEIVDICIR